TSPASQSVRPAPRPAGYQATVGPDGSEHRRRVRHDVDDRPPGGAGRVSVPGPRQGDEPETPVVGCVLDGAERGGGPRGPVMEDQRQSGGRAGDAHVQPASVRQSEPIEAGHRRQYWRGVGGSATRSFGTTGTQISERPTHKPHRQDPTHGSRRCLSPTSAAPSPITAEAHPGRGPAPGGAIDQSTL